jgi:polygalacturonase
MPRLANVMLFTLFLSAATALAAQPTIDITQAGAAGNGTTLNTPAIQKAIDDLAAKGGGTLRFPAGRYLCGTVEIKSNVTLHLDENATLLGSTNPEDYQNLDPFMAGDGVPQGHAFVVARDADHVAIEGPGTIDGQGPALRAKQNPYKVRPFLIRFLRCTNVTVKDAHLTNPGAWTLNFFQTKTATLENLTIRTRGTGLSNNDGINIDSSEGFRIKNCDVNSGDDALVIKSTAREKPCRDIVASDCKLSSSTNAIKLGTESIGGFADISVSNCQVSNVGMAGIAVYTVDGGDLKNVTISDITMDRVAMPIAVRLGARLKTFREGEKARTAAGSLTDVTIKNVSARNIRTIGVLISGIPGHRVENLTLDGITLELPGGGTAQNAQVQLAEKETAYPEYSMFGNTFPVYALYARHVDKLTLNNIQTTLSRPDARPATVFLDVENLNPKDFTPRTQPATSAGTTRP